MRRIVVLVLGTLLLAGCAPTRTSFADDPRAPDRDAAPCDRGASAPFDCHLYVATRATAAGVDAGWLPQQPITVWFEQQNGGLTAILDEPVNTWNVPLDAFAGRFWTADRAAVSAVGCASGGGGTSGCDAGVFVGGLAATDTAYRERGGVLTVSGGGRSLELRPTGLPAERGSVCGTTEVGDLDCRDLRSVTGFADGALLDEFRTDPVAASRAGRVLRIRIAGSTAVLRLPPGDGAAPPATWTPAPPRAGEEAVVLRRVLAAPTVRQHAGAVLLSGGGSSVLLEPGP